VTIGDYDIEITARRIGGAWQALGKMPYGKEVISAPKNSQSEAMDDVARQIRSRLYPQHRYDVNRPFESMNLDERKAKLGSGARFAKLERSLSHQKGIRDPGAVAASVGRKALGKKRFQKLAVAGHHHESLSEMDQAIVLHRADQLLESPWSRNRMKNKRALPRTKASFYPSDGGGGGGGGGICSV
jgi:hypothetical protein